MAEQQPLKRRGVDAAAAYLERVGICVVERSWKCDAGVIDIVAWDGDTLVVVDVRTRRRAGKAAHTPATPASKRRVRRLANSYLTVADLDSTLWRYDRIDLLVIADDRALLRHHRDALNDEE